MMNSTLPLLVIVDGSSYFYRAFHALPPLMNAKGQATGAVYGVVNMLRKLLQTHNPQHIAVVFDAKGKNFRHELYGDYKANRPPMPEELASQFEPMLRLVKALGLPIVMESGVEADDVIATLVEHAKLKNWQIVISTGDKDLAQLVNDNVSLLNTMSQTSLDREAVLKKFGVYPEQVADYLSLMGDKTDNIPGVAGVGPKTAANWLEKYQTLDNLMAHAHELTGKVGETFRNSQTQLLLSRQLTALKTDVILTVSLEDLNPKPILQEAWQQELEALEFKSWLKEPVVNTAPIKTLEEKKPEANIAVNYQIILTQEMLLEWIEKLTQAPYIVLDTETTSLEPLNAVLVGLSFAVNKHEAAYIPLRHDYLGAPVQLNAQEVLQLLKPLLENPKIKKIGQNLKYDYNVLKKENIFLQGMEFDTLLESYLHNTAGRHNLDELAKKYLNHKTMTFEEIAGKGAKQLTFNQIEVEKAGFYAAEDADITLRLHEHLWPELLQHPKMVDLLHNLEMPVMRILSDMEYRGVLIDSKALNQQSKELGIRLRELETQAYDLAGEVFNLQSPKQLLVILYEKHQLPILKKTPKGQPSTAEEVLEELAYSYPLPKVILEYRGLNKLKSTYTDALPQCVHPGTGRVHTSYNQAVTSTGRLSSSQPNLQNIPIRTEEGRRIREAFIAPAGHQLIAADYSQIELRIMAHLSQDPTLLKAFHEGWDVHQVTAAEVNHIAREDVTPEMRRHAKAVNFGLIYGMSAFGLAKQLGIGRDEAQRYIDTYFTRYPGVLEFMNKTREMAHQNGFVETLLGRRMLIPEIYSNNGQRKKAAERAAINAPLQGSAADIIKLAMIKTVEWIREENLPIYLNLQVHDELVFEVPDEHVEYAKKRIVELMSGVMSLSVPLEVSVGSGKHWGQAH